MKHQKKIFTLKTMFMLLLLATVAVILFVFNNLMTIQEHVAFSAHKPVKHQIHPANIKRDLSIPGHLSLKADLYGFQKEQNIKKNLQPLLIILHGGYWQGGNKKNYAHIAGLANKAGFLTIIPELPTLPGNIGQLLWSPQENILLTQKKAMAQLANWLNSEAHTWGGDASHIHILAAGTGATAGVQLAIDSNSAIRTLVLLNPILPVMTGKHKFDHFFIEPALKGLSSEEKNKILSLWQNDLLQKVNIAILYDEQETASTTLIATSFAKANIRADVWQDSRSSAMAGLFRLGRRDEPLTDMLLKFWLDHTN